MLRLSLILLFALVANASQAHAQNRLLTNPGGFNEHQIKWDSAKKLTYFPEEIPKEAPAPSSSHDPDTVAIGSIARFDCWNFRVLQIVDDNNCIITLGKHTYWMANYPTKELADDEAFRIVGEVRMIESKQYQTILGVTRTVKAFSVIDPEERRKAPKNKLRVNDVELKDGTVKSVFAISEGKGLFNVRDEDSKTSVITMKELAPAGLATLRAQLKEIEASKNYAKKEQEKRIKELKKELSKGK
jgi:hypothetical protein